MIKLSPNVTVYRNCFGQVEGAECRFCITYQHVDGDGGQCKTQNL